MESFTLDISSLRENIGKRIGKKHLCLETALQMFTVEKENQATLL